MMKYTDFIEIKYELRTRSFIHQLARLALNKLNDSESYNSATWVATFFY